MMPNGDGHDPRPLWEQVKEDYADRIDDLEKENRSLRDQLRAADNQIEAFKKVMRIIRDEAKGDEPK